MTINTTVKKRTVIPFDAQEHLQELLGLFDAVRAEEDFSPKQLNHLLVKHIHAGRFSVPQAAVVAAYKDLVAEGRLSFDHELFERLKLKPTRTISGVAPVAVLTGPYPCPADCIFCPDAKGVPRSYLPDEPAVQRARHAHFDPYKSTLSRIQALAAMGHAVDKIEPADHRRDLVSLPEKISGMVCTPLSRRDERRVAFALARTSRARQRAGSSSLCGHGDRNAS